MESPEQFVQRYLKEKTEFIDSQFKRSVTFWLKYFTKDYVDCLEGSYRKKEANPEVLVSIETDEQTPHFITKELFGKLERRSRYTLCLLGGQWQISTKESECPACRGTGRKGILELRKCQLCQGSGWKDFQKTAT